MAVDCSVAVPGQFLRRFPDETRIGEGIGQPSENHLRVGVLVQGVNQTLRGWRLPLSLRSCRSPEYCILAFQSLRNSSAFRRKENDSLSSFIPLP